MIDVPLVTTTTFRCDVRDETTSDGDRRQVFRLDGEFDGEAAGQLERATEALAMADEVIVDLAGVTFIDSMGLRLLVQWRRAADEAGAVMALERPAAPVQRLLDSTTLSEFFTRPRSH